MQWNKEVDKWILCFEFRTPLILTILGCFLWMLTTQWSSFYSTYRGDILVPRRYSCSQDLAGWLPFCSVRSGKQEYRFKWHIFPEKASDVRSRNIWVTLIACCFVVVFFLAQNELSLLTKGNILNKKKKKQQLSRLSFHFFFQFMKFVKKLRDGEYTIENNQACFSFIFTVFRLFIAGLSVKSEKKIYTPLNILFFLFSKYWNFKRNQEISK